MEWLIELLVDLFEPILKVVLGIFGYDGDWEPTSSKTQSRSKIFSILICFAIAGIFFSGLIWLGWYFTR
jgi:hypothetical protein